MNRRWLLMLLLLLVVAVSTWLRQHQEQRPAERPENADAQPDYFLRGTESFTTDPSGKIQYRLKAESLSHFADSEELTLVQPEIIVYQPDGSHWTILANHGSLLEHSREILLEGQVRIEHHDTPLPMRLETESLRLLPDSHYAETDAPVRVQSQGNLLSGTGMTLHGDQQRLTLLSRVRGIYHANPSH